MNESHVKELLSSYVDRMLSADETTRVEKHLSQCAACQTHLKELKGMLSWMKTVPKPAARAGLDVRLINRIKSNPAPKAGWFRSWRTLSGGVATLAVGLLIFVMMRDQNGPLQKQQAFREAEAPQSPAKVLDALNGPMGSSAVIGQAKELNQPVPREIQSGNKRGNEEGRQSFADQSVIRRRVEEPLAAQKPAPVVALGMEKKDRLSGSIESDELSDFKKEKISSDKRITQGTDRGEASGGRSPKDNDMAANFAGVHCMIVESEQHVIRSQAEFLSLEKRMHDYPVFPLSVDYSKQMIVAVFMGQAPSSGYSIRIISEEFQNGSDGVSLVIKYKKSRPPERSMTASVMTAPYHMKVIPLFNGPVHFEEVN